MRKLPAYPLFLFLAGSHAFLFTMMSFIHAIYRVEAAHLNPLQLVLLAIQWLPRRVARAEAIT